jgi:hypothetical protein
MYSYILHARYVLEIRVEESGYNKQTWIAYENIYLDMHFALCFQSANDLHEVLILASAGRKHKLSETSLSMVF